MRSNRREFMGTAVAGGLAAACTLSSVSSRAQGAIPEAQKAAYTRLDEILKQPVLKRALFGSPVIIKSVELLRARDSFLCRVRSAEGAEGGLGGMRLG